jgi:secondary thiamine-phosphate synthase enzyme
MKKISLRTAKKSEFIDITKLVKNYVDDSGVEDGICIVFCPHTTAGITLNENHDPSVKTDMIYGLEKISPVLKEFRHSEGNSDAHIKASLLGSSLNLPIIEGKLTIGQWQGIFFGEFDGPRNREIWIKFIKS